MAEYVTDDFIGIYLFLARRHAWPGGNSRVSVCRDPPGCASLRWRAAQAADDRELETTALGDNQHSEALPIGRAAELLNVGERSVARAREVP